MAAKKTTYIATAPDGTEITRSSARAYTHAALVEYTERVKATGAETVKWGSLSFNGREELAVKEANSWVEFIARQQWSSMGDTEERFIRTLVVPVAPKA